MTREARGRVRPAADDVERAARLLATAQRPVIVAGGGAISSEASAEVTALAERLGATVVTTWNGKGTIDETHRLALTIGDTASTCGNALASTADVILSVGNRFTDWSASSSRPLDQPRTSAKAGHSSRRSTDASEPGLPRSRSSPAQRRSR